MLFDGFQSYLFDFDVNVINRKYTNLLKNAQDLLANPSQKYGLQSILFTDT